MEELVFATYLKEMKEAWNEEISDPTLIEVLYDGVADPLGLLNKEKDTISVPKSVASKIVNRQKSGNPLKVIRNGAGQKKVRDSIPSYFQKKILKELHPERIDDLIAHLKAIIENDTVIADSKKTELLSYADKNHLAEFLGYIYIYTLTRDNVLKEIRFKTDREKEEYKHRQLDKITVPKDVEKTERKYVDALMAVYGQLEGIPDFNESNLSAFPNYEEHFSDQREYYFAAEAVRRGTRDVYSSEDQFEILKDETYEGVKETWEEEYRNGMMRLRRVMTQASNTRVDRCGLSKDTEWIGNPQKKGVCHFLVKENKLKGWVRDDDEQAI